MAAGNFYGGAFFGGGFFGSLPSTTIVGGGVARGYSGYEVRQRSKKEIRQERERLGILPAAAEVIESVARRQAENLRLDEQQRFEELQRELEAQELEWHGKYLELLNTLRESFIRDEIARLLRIKLVNDENERILMLMAALS